MKTLIKTTLAITVLLTASLTTQAQCLGEAQIIAQVASSQKTSQTSCKVQIKEVRHYAASMVCPLDLTDIMAEGITTATLADGSCLTEEISGVVVRTSSGDLILD